MEKILDFDRLPKLLKSPRLPNQKIVLVGGVFDILHFGHVRFLEEAKKAGDILVVAIEPDSKVKKTKGEGRPINSETIRSHMIASLECVDYVVVLPELTTHEEYFNITKTIAPSIIAVTEGDPMIEEKRKQMESLGGTLKVVTPSIPTPSTTQLIKLLSLE